jgi:copper chaperone CopZ
MNIWNLQVTGMYGGSCAAAVKRAVVSLDPAGQVEIDRERGHVQVHTERQRSEIETKIRSLEYGVSAADE